MPENRLLLIDEFIHSYRQTAQLVFKDMQNLFPEQIGQGGFAILKVLLGRGAWSQHAIAEALCHSDAAVSRQITLLAEKGYVSAEPDPENRRQSLIRLTQAGEQIMAEIKAKMHSHLTELLSSLSDEQLKECITLNQTLQHCIISKQKEGLNE